MVKVSIIIPVYNVEAYLSQCLDSLLQQSLQDFEIICVDDGSTDNSLLILNQYAKEDDRIIIRKQKNKGAGAARNLGLLYAQGEYVIFLDSDDFFETDMLEKCVSTLDKDQSDLVGFLSQRYYQRTGKYVDMPDSIRLDNCPSHSPFYAHEAAKHIFNIFQIAPWNKMYSHSFIKSNKLFFQEIPRANDVAFSIHALGLADKISIIKEHLANYRFDTGTSLTATKVETPLAFWNAFKEAKKRLIEAGVYDKYEQSFLNITLKHIFLNLRSLSNTASYRDVLYFIKYHAEKDFGFMVKPVDWYYDLKLLSAYCKIKGQVKTFLKPVPVPKISVVIPVLNSRPYIRECVESVLEQSMTDIEVLCIDAGSEDGTVEILEEYAKKDKRLKVIHSDKKSYGYQVNLGVDEAKGKYLAIIESDDYIVSDGLLELLNTIEETRAEVLKANYHIFIGEWNQRKFSFRRIMEDKQYYDKLLDPSEDFKVFSGSNVPWTGLYSLEFLRKNAIRLNETPGASYQNNGLWFQCMALSNKVYFLSKSFYSYRGDNAKSSINSTGKVFCMCDEYNFIQNFLDKDEYLKGKFSALCAYYRYVKYIWTLQRIADEFKEAFLQRFAEDFRKIECSNELDRKLYSEQEWNTLHGIMENPIQYLKRMESKKTSTLKPPKTENELLKEALKLKNSTIQGLENDNQKLKNDIAVLQKAEQNLQAEKEILLKDTNQLRTNNELLQKDLQSLRKSRNNLEKESRIQKEFNKELKRENQTLKKENKALQENNQNVLNKLHQIQNSKAYCRGATLAYPVRKVRKVLHRK